MDVTAIKAAFTVAAQRAIAPVPAASDTVQAKGDEVKLSARTSGLKATGIGFAAGVTTSAILATTTVRVLKGGGMAQGLGALYLAGDSIIGGVAGGPAGTIGYGAAEFSLRKK